MGALSIALTSGKGGVGKSVIAANLAVALGRVGQQVLLVDGDLGLGNLSTLLGVSPEFALEDVLAGRRSAADALVPGPEGISVLCAATDGDTRCWSGRTVKPAIVAELVQLEEQFDCVVVDTGAGVEPRSLDLVTAAVLGLIVVTPEPTAIGDAYATLKVLHQRGIRSAPGLLVNMADSGEEAADLHTKFAELAGRFLGVQIDNWGHIPLDRNVREAVKHQVPFVLMTPPTPSAAAVAELAGALLQHATGRPMPGGEFFAGAWSGGGSGGDRSSSSGYGGRSPRMRNHQAAP